MQCEHTDLQLWLSTVNYSPGRYSRLTWNSATFLKPHIHLWVGRDSYFVSMLLYFAVTQLNVRKKMSEKGNFYYECVACDLGFSCVSSLVLQRFLH